MYGYMQPTNPYQQNIDIIRNFFKRPIVLVSAIFSIIAFALNFFNSLYKSMIINTSIEQQSLHSNNYGIFSFVYAIVISIFWIMLYNASKSERHSHKATSSIKVLNVFSIINLVLISIASFLIIMLSLFLMIFARAFDQLATFLDSEFFASDLIFGLGKLSYNEFIAITIAEMIAVIIFFFYILANFMFINSVKKSMTTIFLKKSGASAFGVLSFVLAAFNLIGLLPILRDMNFNISTLLSIASTLCFSISFLLSGILALQYNGYISKHINGQTQKHQYNTATTQQPFVPPVQNDYYVPVNNTVPAPPQNSSAKAQPYPIINPNPQPVKNNIYVRAENYNVQAVDDIAGKQAPVPQKQERPSYNETDSYLF